MASSRHIRSSPSAETYLGFIDRAVESIVFLIIQQAEIQRPQRGCKGEKLLLTHGPQQTPPLLPLSTKGVDVDAREMAADVIKHKASSCEPCYETWFHAGRLVAAWPAGLARPWERSERDERLRLARALPPAQRLCLCGLSHGSPHLSAAPPQPAASRPPGAEGSSPGRSRHGWDTAGTCCRHISSPPALLAFPECVFVY